ncbi:hypothetical protein K438DRAFT_1980997 [Mycena galopus ATCC 62051]|nr:hypothetical protein K438DRAFT_1980997 [Mycena galopus ATCC 62051]
MFAEMLTCRLENATEYPFTAFRAYVGKGLPTSFWHMSAEVDPTLTHVTGFADAAAECSD